MNKYMHLLEGRPAYYDGDQVCFAVGTIKVTELCSSLEELKEQYRLSENWRIDKNLTPYDYIHSWIKIKD